MAAKKKHFTKATYLQVRCTEADKKRWGRAAKKEGLSLAAWIRDIADEAAKLS